MAEFVQNYHIKNFLNLSNDQECNFFDKKLFGLSEIRNPRIQNDAIVDEIRNIEDEDEDEPHCEHFHQTHSCPNNVMTDYLKKAREDILRVRGKRIPLTYNSTQSEVISTSINDYFVKPVFTWFPETWINNGEIGSLKCPNCLKAKLTRNKICQRNVECMDTNAFVLYSQFTCTCCNHTFDALTNTEKALKSGIPLYILQRCPIGGILK